MRLQMRHWWTGLCLLLGTTAFASPQNPCEVGYGVSLYVVDLHKKPRFYASFPGEETINLNSRRPPAFRPEAKTFVPGEISTGLQNDVLIFPQGVSADGVTSLLLAFQVHPEEGCVTFSVQDENGLLAGPGQVGQLRHFDNQAISGNPLEVTPRPVENYGNWAFAIYQAPENFDRSSADHELSDRNITIEATYQKAADCPTPFLNHHSSCWQATLARPPVVLSHGLWADEKSWSWQAVQGSPFESSRVNYPSTNAASFYQNNRVVYDHIQTILEERRRDGIATTQVDFIGHSMGGLLGRLHAENWHVYSNGRRAAERSERHINWDQGDFHKLITLDSPHKGSKWGNFLIDLSNTNIVVTLPGSGVPLIFPKLVVRGLMESVGQAAGKPIFQGAVYDLQEGSPEITAMIEAKVACHALVGTGGKGLMSALGSDLEDVAEEALVVPFATWPFNALWSDLEAFINSQFGGEEHDLIVGQTSMEGGLSSAVTNYFSPPHEAIHISLDGATADVACSGAPNCVVGVTRSSIFGARAKELLHSSLTLGVFESEFPSNAGPMPQAGSGGGGGTFQVPGGYQLVPSLEVVPGGVAGPIYSGGTLSVRVRPLNGFQPAYVWVVWDHGVEAGVPDSQTGEFDVDLAVPLDFTGLAKVDAMAITEAGNYGQAVAVPFSILVPPGDALVGQSGSPSPIDLYDFQPGVQVRIEGLFNLAGGGTLTRDITSSVSGTTYGTDDPSVAVVGAEGFVSAVGLGTTQLTYQSSHGGSQSSIPITVHSVKGDVDRDGDWDLTDFGYFAACYLGLQADPLFDYPGVSCTGSFDFDGDFDVDDDDFNEFRTRYSGPVMLPCSGGNIPAVNAMQGILNGAYSDCDHDGIPDQCDPGKDCNGNAIADSCEITPKNYGFYQATEYSTQNVNGPTQLVTGDFDGDGDEDVAAITPGGGLSFLLNQGSTVIPAGASFLPASGSLQSLAADDFDGDGKTDLVLGYQMSSGNAQIQVLSDGVSSGNAFLFSAWSRALSSAPVGTSPVSIAVGNFDNAGLPDLAVLKTDGAVGEFDVLMNFGDGTFASPSDRGVPPGCRSISAGDLDLDGAPDLVVTSFDTNDILLFRNAGGSFRSAGDATLNAPGILAPIDALVGDFSGDGRNDLLVADQIGNGLTMFENKNTGGGFQFASNCNFATASTPNSLAAEDVNGDGRLDIVVSEAFSNTIAVVLGSPRGCTYLTGPVVDQASYPAGVGCEGVGVADLNGDGTPDLVSANRVDNSLSVLLNHTQFPTSLDVDGNGVPDECDLANDCTGNSFFDSCDIVNDPALNDCNQNFVPDICELAADPGLDCNGNGTMDSCEILSGAEQDCNGNGVPDSCDIQSLASEDCNSNGVPDECESPGLPVTLSSPSLSPITFGTVQDYTFPSPSYAGSSVTLTFKAETVFDSIGQDYFLVQFVNDQGAPLGSPSFIFVCASPPCYESCGNPFSIVPEDYLTLSASQFNSYLDSTGGDLRMQIYPQSGFTQDCPNGSAMVVDLDYTMLGCQCCD